MLVSDAMSTEVLTVGPTHTLREAARAMSSKKVGAAVVIDPEAPGPGILTERDVLRSLAECEHPGDELVCEHQTDALISASPDWSLEQAAEAMIEHGFRHLLVVDGGELVGILSMRDIVRCWAVDRVAS